MPATMAELARRAGETPTDHPASACIAIARFLNEAESQVPHHQPVHLHSVIPAVTGSRLPLAITAREEYPVSQALLKWTPEALRAAGRIAFAEILDAEPNLTKAPQLLRQFTQTLDRELPTRPTNRKERIELHALKTLRAAACALVQLDHHDWTRRQNAVPYAANAAVQWSLATGTDLQAELIATVSQILKITAPPELPHTYLTD